MEIISGSKSHKRDLLESPSRVWRDKSSCGCLCSQEGAANSWELDKVQCLDRDAWDAELSKMETSRVRTDGISGHKLGGAQGLVGFPVQGLVGFCGKIGDWCLLFRVFT